MTAPTPIRDVSKPTRCRHTYLASATPCPFGCHPAELSALQGPPATPEAIAAKGAAMRTGTLQSYDKNPRALKLEGETLAGCAVGKVAADGAHHTRFHCVMACGHVEIVGGTDLKQAHKKGLVLKCKPCARVDIAAMRAKRLAERKAGRS